MQSDPKSAELAEKIRCLEEEVRLLLEKNAAMQRWEAERLSKESFTEQTVLNSRTFGLLLEQAEQMAQDYDEIKEKYTALEIKYKDSCIKHEQELKEFWSHEREALEKVIEQMSELERKEDAKEMGETETEVDKHYKKIIELKKIQIEKLEGDLLQAEKQLNILKEEKKAAVDNTDKTIEDILRKETKDSDKVKRLVEVLQEKVGELASERQMQETWIAELEVASKTYEQEKNYGKTLAKEVTTW